MKDAAFIALSPLDGRYANKLSDIHMLCSEQGFMQLRLFIEIEWLIFLQEQIALPDFPPLHLEDKKALREFGYSFGHAQMQQLKQIEMLIKHDVKAVEYLLKEFCGSSKTLVPLVEWIHFGCTSEDINNIAYALMLQKARAEYILPNLQSVHRYLVRFASTYHNLAMLSRTHGQPATPTTLGKEIANVAYRLERQIKQLQSQEILGKWNGAVGNMNAHLITYPELDWLEISKNFVTHLGLTWNPFTTQIEPHDYMAEFFHTLIRINTILIDFSRDIWGYISLDYFEQALSEQEVGSSTMPHKINPIDFENAEGNLGFANSLLAHFAEKLPISRFQRDLSDSTVLRNIGVVLGHCLLAYHALEQGLSKLKVNTQRLQSDLELHWEVLAEALQTVMRRFGIPEPYEKLKAFTRGQKITQESLHHFIRTLALPETVQQHLLHLKPQDYTGYASQLALTLRQ